MTLPSFTPVFRSLDHEREDILNYIAKTAYNTKHGGILNDVGLERLKVAVSDLERIERAYEEVKEVERLVESILPESERSKPLSDIITG